MRAMAWLRSCAMLVTGGWAAVCAAQMPSQADIEKKMEELRRSVPRQLEEAARRAGAEQRRVDSGQVRAAPAAADPARIAEQYRAASGKPGDHRDSRVIVFASLSMPTESLRRLAADAALAGVPIYFRGLRYGLGPGKTQRGLAELQPLVELGASVQIHPEAFEMYGVRSVPVFVVASGSGECGRSSCENAVGRVSGDVSLGYALQKLADRRDDVGAVARAALARMGSGDRR